MRFGDQPGDRQTQPGTLGGARGIASVEALEEVRELLGGHPAATIADGHDCVAVRRPCGDVDAAFVGVLDGVVEHVDEEAHKRVAVALHHEAVIRLAGESQALVVGEHLERRADVARRR